MISPESERDRDDSHWLEALHDAIATDTEAEFDLTPGVAPAAEFETLRDCLRLLDRFRRQQDVAATRPKQIGRFEIIREVGRGGFGVVFVAIDPRVGRRVAVKIPRPEVLSGRSTRSRFLREAKAAGGLAHPNLIPIHEVGEDGPICYIASAFCSGPNLAQWLAECTRPVPERDAAAMIRSLARGVAHAHQRGVLHRDIKPSNVLLEPCSESSSTDGAVEARTDFTPRLTDFGLAKVAELAEDQTRSGTLLGTPAYMSPEQAEGRLDDIGPATDVYALGALLYEMLAGQPPLRGQTDVQTLQLVARGEIPHLRRFRPRVSRDVEAIALKCMERVPTNRYGSADKLADDLDRFLQGIPTRARPASSLERIWKAALRRPGLSAMGGIVAAAIFALACGGWWHSTQLRTAFDLLQAQKQQTDEHLYADSMKLADQAIKANQIQHAQEHLIRWIPRSGEADLRSFAWHQLWRQLHEQELTLTGHMGDVHSVRYSPDGRRLVTASQDGTARIWDAATGKCLFVLSGHEGEVNCAAFSRDGRLVATAGDDGMVCIWGTTDGRLNNKRRSHKGHAIGVAFSPVNQTFASCGSDNWVKLVDSVTGKLVTQFTGHENAVEALAFSPDGRRLATASDDASARIWDVATGEQVRGLVHEGAVNCLSFSSDGTRLLTGQRSERCIRQWDLAHEMDSHEERMARSVVSRHYDNVHAVAFDPTNHFYAVATKGGAVELIDSSTGNAWRRLPGHFVRVWSLSFSSDGRHLATASADRTVKIWNLTDGPEKFDESSSISAMSSARDAQTVAVGNTDGIVTIYNLATRQASRSMGREFQVVGDFNGDGRLDSGLFVDGLWQLSISTAEPRKAGQDTELQIRFGGPGDSPVVGDWDGDGRDDLGCFQPSLCRFSLDLDHSGGEAESARDLGPLSAGTRGWVPLVGRWEEGERDSVGIALMTSAGWNFQFARKHGNPLTAVVKADGIPLAGRWQTGRPDGWGIWDRRAGIWVDIVPQVTSANQPSAKAKKQRLPKFASRDTLSIDPLALEAAFDCAESNPVQALAIAHDGARIAFSYIHDYRLHIREVASGREIRVLRMDAGNVIDAAFSPDARNLAVASNTGEVVLYDGSTFQLVNRFKAHDNKQLIKIAYSHGARLLATIGDSNILNLWDEQGRRVKSLQDPVASPFKCLAFSADDRLIAVGGADRIVRIWNTETGQKIASLVGHTQGVTGVAFSADMRCLATAGDDGAIKLWDVPTWQELSTLVDGLKPFTFVNFIGGHLIAAGDRNVLHGRQAAIQFWASGQPVGNPPANDSNARSAAP